MEKKNYSTWSDEELLVEKQKLKKSKLYSAVFIGFFAGVFGYGMVNWLMNPERKLGFLIPILIPIVFIYELIKNRNVNKELETVLIERGLN